MPWMLEKREYDAPQRMKTLLAGSEIIQTPGAHDALTGLMAKKLGFKALYISGAAFSASRGMPDIGYFTVTELADYVRGLYQATNLPILVDVDTGFGEVVHIPRMVLEMEGAGAAMVQMEDQKLPKKCGHLEGKELVTADEMCRKIDAVMKTRKNMLLLARTDAHAIYGIEEAIKRAKMYVNAGADAIFPEALKTEAEFKQFAAEVKVPLLANMTEFGKTPYFKAKDLQAWGYKLVIYPVTSLRSQMKAVERVFTAIKNDGSQEAEVKNMQTRQELYDLIDYAGYGEFDEGVAKSKFI
ncbi:MAG: methylisocitrate lyase [Leptospiraceae bacterium]|nr:methylisocitrate lyase [Leptospiraceae bacterium]